MAKRISSLRDEEGEILEEGRIKDIPFPQVSPDLKDISLLGFEVLKQLPANGEIKDEFGNGIGTHFCMVMGEMSLCFSLTEKLLEMQFRVIVSTTLREVVEKDGIKKSIFKFIKFREIKKGLLTIPRGMEFY